MWKLIVSSEFGADWFKYDNFIQPYLKILFFFLKEEIVQQNFKLFLETYKIFHLLKFYKTLDLLYSLEGPCSFFSLLFFSPYFGINVNHNVYSILQEEISKEGALLLLEKFILANYFQHLFSWICLCLLAVFPKYLEQMFLFEGLAICIYSGEFATLVDWCLCYKSEGHLLLLSL